MPILRPSRSSGWVAALVAVGVGTALVYPLKRVAPVASLGVVYLLGVAVVSAFWGIALGAITSFACAAAFNFFHLEPTGRFTISDPRNWVALAAFVVIALTTSVVSEQARARAREAERRRGEADLNAEMAQRLLEGTDVDAALALIARRLAQTFALASAAIVPATRSGDERRIAIPVVAASEQIATLLVPAGIADANAQRLRERVAPALGAVLAAARERERLSAELVATEAVRRSEAVKTAVLRAVSHDLRSPLTAMVAAGSAVRAPDLSLVEREELGTLVVDEGARLSRLISNLLDLSRLEAGAAVPELAECSLEEVVDAAVAAQPAPDGFRLSIEECLPPVRADFVQLERAFSNLLENAARYAGGQPVQVRASAVGAWVVVRIVDRGPGIPPEERARVFEAFYRRRSNDGHTGSGLGLAIAKGFVEGNRGRVWVESVLGQGSAFVVELPAASPAHARHLDAAPLVGRADRPAAPLPGRALREEPCR
jgi:two-component system sensor histidine kinase KdpD